MLKRKNRLPKGYLKSEKTINSSICVLKIAKNGSNLSRFGFVVSKKIDKRATARNRIKREFRKCLEDKLNEIVKGYDFLFIIKNNIEKKNYCEILYSQLRKEKLLK